MKMLYKTGEVAELAELIGVAKTREKNLETSLNKAAETHMPEVLASRGPILADRRGKLAKLASIAALLATKLDELDDGALHMLQLNYKGALLRFETYKNDFVISRDSVPRTMFLAHATTPRARLGADKVHLKRLRDSLSIAAADVPKKGGRHSIAAIERHVETLASIYVTYAGGKFSASRKRGRDQPRQFVRRAMQIAYPDIKLATIDTAVGRETARRISIERELFEI